MTGLEGQACLLAPFVLGFLRARIGSQIEGTQHGKEKKPKNGEFIFFLRLAFAWQGLAGLDSSGKRQMKTRSKTSASGALTKYGDVL